MKVRLQVVDVSNLCALSKLKRLDICLNSVRFIPSEISQLRKLEHLRLNGCSCVDLPATISSLRSLHSLEMAQMDPLLTDFPAVLCQCRQLT